MLRFSLEHKILVGYIILVSVIFCMTLTILYEQHQIQKIESETFEIRTLRQNINTIHRYITKLSISGESVIDWDETDYRIYQINRLHTDSLLQAMKPYCINIKHRFSMQKPPAVWLVCLPSRPPSRQPAGLLAGLLACLPAHRQTNLPTGHSAYGQLKIKRKR